MAKPKKALPIAIALLGLAAAGMVFVSLRAIDGAAIEQSMGMVQKVFYYHVGSAIATVLAFTTVLVCSILFLATRREKYDVAARSAAGIGVLFCTLVLTTGSIWARGSTWEQWWLWDEPRLFTSLVMWFMYLAYLILGLANVQDRSRSARFMAVYGIISYLTVPIVYFSTRTMKTIHPITVDLAGGGMRPALRLSMITFGLLYFFLFLLRLRLEMLSARADTMRQRLEDIEDARLLNEMKERAL